jgi:hypothetical protein
VVLSQLQELQDAVEPVLKLMQRDDVMKTMETMRDSKMLINYLTTNKEFEVFASKRSCELNNPIVLFFSLKST